jgi:diguanylate cyclase (GGDEF)-like protein
MKNVPGTITVRKINIYAIFFVALVCISLLALHGLTTWNAYQQSIKEARSQVSNLSNSQAQQAEDAIMSADVVLNGILQRLEVEAISNDALTRLYPLLVSQIHALPYLHGLFVYDSAGNGLVSSMSDIPWSMSDYDREYFAYHSAHTDRELHIGAPIKSRLTGDPVIPVSRRLNHADGSFAGVIVATLYVNYFQQFYNSFDSDSKNTVILGLQNGSVLVHYPDTNTNSVSDRQKQAIVFQDMVNNHTTGISTVRFATDNDQHVVGFERIDKYPVFIMTDMPMRYLMERWRNDTFIQTMIILVLFVFFVVSGSHLVKQIVQRSKTEEALRQARTDLVILNQALQKQALEDGLTRIANRRHFDTTLEAEFARGRRTNSPLSLLMIDVDFFKKYNDTYGHVAGDHCLQSIAKLIQTNRSGDLCARYGGEEFAVLLPDTDAEGAMQVAEMIRQQVEDQAIPHSANALGVVTVSIGAYTNIPGKDDAQPYDWVGHADAALYHAKTSGRNKVSNDSAPAIEADEEPVNY